DAAPATGSLADVVGLDGSPAPGAGVDEAAHRVAHRQGSHDRSAPRDRVAADAAGGGAAPVAEAADARAGADADPAHRDGPAVRRLGRGAPGVRAWPDLGVALAE